MNSNELTYESEWDTIAYIIQKKIGLHGGEFAFNRELTEWTSNQSGAYIFCESNPHMTAMHRKIPIQLHCNVDVWFEYEKRWEKSHPGQIMAPIG